RVSHNTSLSRRQTSVDALSAAGRDTQGSARALSPDDNAGHLSFDGAAAGGAVFLVERIESLDPALHQARPAAPPDRRRSYIAPLEARALSGRAARRTRRAPSPSRPRCARR